MLVKNEKFCVFLLWNLVSSFTWTTFLAALSDSGEACAQGDLSLKTSPFKHLILFQRADASGPARLRWKLGSIGHIRLVSVFVFSLCSTLMAAESNYTTWLADLHLHPSLLFFQKAPLQPSLWFCPGKKKKKHLLPPKEHGAAGDTWVGCSLWL